MPQAMAIEIQKQCETIEECYEFTLSFAARGLLTDEGSGLRERLTRSAETLRGLAQSCAETAHEEALEPAAKYEAFFTVLRRDAESALAAMELVLAQPAISSQLVDTLNASIHLRALLADLFLLTEILDARQASAKAAAVHG